MTETTAPRPVDEVLHPAMRTEIEEFLDWRYGAKIVDAVIDRDNLGPRVLLTIDPDLTGERAAEDFASFYSYWSAEGRRSEAPAEAVNVTGDHEIDLMLTAAADVLAHNYMGLMTNSMSCSRSIKTVRRETAPGTPWRIRMNTPVIDPADLLPLWEMIRTVGHPTLVELPVHDTPITGRSLLYIPRGI